MAYLNQADKAQKAPAIKAICKKYGIKASLAIENHSSLVLNIQAGKIDFIGNYNETMANDPNSRNTTERDYIQVNPYWFQNHVTGDALAFLSEVIAAMNVGNYDNSDVQSDYFDTGWYSNINIGKWNKPYIVTK